MENAAQESVLVAWVGEDDIRALNAWCGRNGVDATVEGAIRSCTDMEEQGTCGPVRTLSDTLAARTVYLLFSAGLEKEAGRMCEWVERGTKARCEIVATSVMDPASYEEVWQATEQFFKAVWNSAQASSFNYLVSAGTPAMQAILFYASQVRYAGGHAWRVADSGPAGSPRCVEVHLPFRLPAEVWPSAPQLSLADEALYREVLSVYAPVRSINILLLGETGVGKAHFARRIHTICAGSRNNFAELNCATLAAGETEAFRCALFGRQTENGVCTGALEQARGGTLFLNEVNALPVAWQAQLALALTEQAYDVVGGGRRRIDNVRILSSSSVDLASAVREGRFRQDLFYALAMCPVSLPALRDLVNAPRKRFRSIVLDLLGSLRKEAKELDCDWQLSAEAWAVLRAYPWPGNVRELRQILLLSCVSALARETTVITDKDIEHHLALLRPLVTSLLPGVQPQQAQQPVQPVVAQPAAPVQPAQTVLEDAVPQPEAAAEPAAPVAAVPVAEPARAEAAEEEAALAATPAPAASAAVEDDDFLPSNLEQWLADKRVEFINKALARCNGSKAKAGKLLGLTYQQMLYFEKRAGQPVTRRGGRRRKEADVQDAAQTMEQTASVAEGLAEPVAELSAAPVAAVTPVPPATPAAPEAPETPAAQEAPVAAESFVQPEEPAVPVTAAPAAEQVLFQPEPQPASQIVEQPVVEPAPQPEAAAPQQLVQEQSVQAQPVQEQPQQADQSAQAEGSAAQPSIDEIADHIVAQMARQNF